VSDERDALARGRDAFARRAWSDACAELAPAAADVDDLDRLAIASYLTGRDAECIDAWARAHREAMHGGDIARAARCAFWLGFTQLLRNEVAVGSGWLARAQRLLDDAGLDTVEQGYVLLPGALQRIESDPETAFATFERAGRIGERFGDSDLATIGRLGRGQSLVNLGRVAEGVAWLDEALVAVTAGEASPIVVGIVYCAVIQTLHGISDLRRAQEWTAVLTDWCASQPDLVPYRGQCLVHRAEIMQLHGDWSDAFDEVRRACEHLSRPPAQPAVGDAHYQQGELHRLRGEAAEAEAAYRRASDWGRAPYPGLALLRLAQGRAAVAAAAVRRVLDESGDRVARSSMLGPAVEVLLAAGDLTAAREAADELQDIAAEVDLPAVEAAANEAAGAVRLAEGDPRGALGPLRAACQAWRGLDAPYQAARVRVLLGRAYRQLGDEDGAALELDAARATFERLGAVPDLARLAEPQSPPGGRDRAGGPGPGGLTGREIEVLALVASGKTNRAIASELVISEKTVARHLSNIFTKLGLSSRAAATAYAYEHHLVHPSA
jgi:DNA-binding CsgD family transcriptional regulator